MPFASAPFSRFYSSHDSCLARLAVQALVLIGMTAYMLPTDAAEALGDAAHTVALKPAQVKSLALRTARIQPAGDAGRVVLQGQVSLPPQLLRVMSAPVAGLIEQLHVAKGDAVRNGQTLVSLNAPQLVEWQREYQQAGLQLKLAQQTASRDAALLAEGIIPASRAQASQSQLQIAQAALRERGQLLQMAGVQPSSSLSGRVAMSAPGKGAVVDVMVQPGQRVEAGSPLLKFASQGALSIDLQAAPDVARRLRTGDVVRVQGCAMPARLVSINTLLDNNSQMLALRAQWPQANDCALPQQRVQAEVALSIPAGTNKAVNWLVPATAVLKHDGQDIVFVQRGQRFSAIAVRVLGQQGAPEGGSGADKADWRQIAAVNPEQLRADDEVVTQGTVALKGAIQGLGVQ